RVEGVVSGGAVYLWGHAYSNRHGEPIANLHINILGEVDDEAVFDVVEELGGSVAAEHGVGTAKRHRAAGARSDLDQLRVLKNRLDPAGILNPGVLLPPA
ncbi:MAG: hypothetical protein OER12_03235, partial [Acidimicrobiia bacterium]|nr:hypothetical protein [Acidimicrobiia bacterium]